MRVSSIEPQVDIVPGDRADVTLDIVNTSEVIDGVSAHIVGLDDRNVTSRPMMLPLFPDASGQITLTVHLPQTFPAGRHPMTVEVRSRQVDTPPSYVNLDLLVPRVPAVALTSRPELVRARRTGRFIVTVANRGNTLLDADLTITDPNKACAISVEPRSVTLAAGASAEAIVTVRAPRMWMGTDNDRSLTAEVSATVVAPASPGARPLGPGRDTDLADLDGLAGAGVTGESASGVGVIGVIAMPASTSEDRLPSAELVAPDPAAEPVTDQRPITFRQRPLISRGVLTALILVAIIALWAAAFLFGLSKVFAGDPMTKTAPASFFAATPEANDEGSGAGGSGAGGTGADGTTDGGAADGDSATGNAGDTSGGTGTAGDAGAVGAAAAAGSPPAGALRKDGTLPPGVGGTISGTVTAASSAQPVGRVLVEALRVKADGSLVMEASAATQSDGSFEVAGLFPGPYLLKFTAPGIVTSYYPDAASPSAATPLTADAGDVTSGGDAVVTGLPATITGSVDFGDITKPVATTVGAQLLGPGADDATPIPTVTTGADGSYTLPNLPAPGTYLLTFTTDGYETTTLKATVTGGANRFESTVILSAGQVSISGTVTDGSKPLGGATVTTTVNGQEVSTGTPTTGEVGHFVIDNLPTPATYIVTVSKGGYGKVSQVIDLAPGTTKNDLTIALHAGTGVVTGQVSDPAGNGIGGATVSVGGLADAPSTITLTDGAVGSFRLTGLPVPGAYTLTLTADGFADQTVPVTLAADEPLAPIAVTMTASTGAISGTVSGPDGAGLAGATVTATNGLKSWPVVTTANAAGGTPGTFTIANLPPGVYTVSAMDKQGHGATTITTVAPNSTVTLQFAFTAEG